MTILHIITNPCIIYKKMARTTLHTYPIRFLRDADTLRSMWPSLLPHTRLSLPPPRCDRMAGIMFSLSTGEDKDCVVRSDWVLLPLENAGWYPTLEQAFGYSLARRVKPRACRLSGCRIGEIRRSISRPVPWLWALRPGPRSLSFPAHDSWRPYDRGRELRACHSG